MKKEENNYAFIDSQNLYRGIKSQRWSLNWERFRVYLQEKYAVSTAYLFIGYIPEHNDLYDELQKAGFILKFKPVLPNGKDGVKGNVDSDLVLQAMIELDVYDKAVIISSDGDFYSLVRYLYGKGKLKMVMSPHSDTCSSLLKKTAKEKIVYMDNLIKRIGKKKSTA